MSGSARARSFGPCRSSRVGTSTSSVGGSAWSTTARTACSGLGGRPVGRTSTRSRSNRSTRSTTSWRTTTRPRIRARPSPERSPRSSRRRMRSLILRGRKLIEETPFGAERERGRVRTSYSACSRNASRSCSRPARASTYRERSLRCHPAVPGDHPRRMRTWPSSSPAWSFRDREAALLEHPDRGDVVLRRRRRRSGALSPPRGRPGALWSLRPCPRTLARSSSQPRGGPRSRRRPRCRPPARRAGRFERRRSRPAGSCSSAP